MYNFNAFVAAYITCLQWSTTGTDQHGEDHESLESFEISLEAKERIIKDCQSFFDNYSHLLEKAVGENDYQYDRAGHDFWLTRNHHGAGFWDRDLGEVGEQLTAAAQSFGECDPYIGDDGKIYF